MKKHVLRMRQTDKFIFDSIKEGLKTIETRVAELRCSATGVIDPVQVQKIVGMKLHLDSLYIDWVNSKMS